MVVSLIVKKTPNHTYCTRYICHWENERKCLEEFWGLHNYAKSLFKNTAKAAKTAVWTEPPNAVCWKRKKKWKTGRGMKWGILEEGMADWQRYWTGPFLLEGEGKLQFNLMRNREDKEDDQGVRVSSRGGLLNWTVGTRFSWIPQQNLHIALAQFNHHILTLYPSIMKKFPRSNPERSEESEIKEDFFSKPKHLKRCRGGRRYHRTEKKQRPGQVQWTALGDRYSQNTEMYTASLISV